MGLSFYALVGVLLHITHRNEVVKITNMRYQCVSFETYLRCYFGSVCYYSSNQAISLARSAVPALAS